MGQNGWQSNSEPAPGDAEFILAAADSELPNARVLTDTAAFAFDTTTPGQVAGVPTPATTSQAGIVELATDGQSAASLVPQANDSRLSNARTPTAHASSHLSGGSDPIAAATTSARGTVELATDRETASSVAVQGSDSRLKMAPMLVTPAEAVLPAAGFAVAGLSAGNKPILTYADAVTSTAYFTAQVPFGYAGVGGTLRLWWAPGAAAGPGDVRWSIGVERMVVGDSIATGNNQVEIQNITTGTQNIIIASDIAASTGVMDLMAAGDWIRFIVARIGGNAADTFVGDAYFLGLQFIQ